MSSRNPSSISITDCRTVPPWKSRAAPEARLAMPEATAAICSARSGGSCSLEAMGRPSAETRMAWETPGVSVANLATSQSYSPLGWAMASVVNIGFLSVVTVLGFGAGGAHTLLVAVEPAADCLGVAPVRCRCRSVRCVHVLDRTGDQEAPGAALGQTGRGLLIRLRLLDPGRCGPRRVSLGGRPGGIVGGRRRLVREPA